MANPDHPPRGRRPAPSAPEVPVTPEPPDTSAPSETHPSSSERREIVSVDALVERIQEVDQRVTALEAECAEYQAWSESVLRSKKSEIETYKASTEQISEQLDHVRTQIAAEDEQGVEADPDHAHMRRITPEQKILSRLSVQYRDCIHRIRNLLNKIDSRLTQIQSVRAMREGNLAGPIDPTATDILPDDPIHAETVIFTAPPEQAPPPAPGDPYTNSPEPMMRRNRQGEWLPVDEALPHTHQPSESGHAARTTAPAAPAAGRLKGLLKRLFGSGEKK